jgi:hypothetical protein
VAAEGSQGGRREAGSRQCSPEAAPAAAVAGACSLAVVVRLAGRRMVAVAAAAVVGCLGLAMKVGLAGLVARLEEDAAEAALVAVLQVDRTIENMQAREASIMYTCSENRLLKDACFVLREQDCSIKCDGRAEALHNCGCTHSNQGYLRRRLVHSRRRLLPRIIARQRACCWCCQAC